MKTLVVTLLVAALAAPVRARAHAILVESSPADQAALKEAPPRALLRFNGRIEKGVSQVTLYDSAGKKLALPDGAAQRGAGPPDQLVIPLPKLPPGQYRLQYRILAIDGHATPGQIRFSIQGKGAT
jgi:methionine-rich copper-binding protein CopC